MFYIKRWQTVEETVRRGLERVAIEEAFYHQVPCHDTDRLYLTPLLYTPDPSSSPFTFPLLAGY